MMRILLTILLATAAIECVAQTGAPPGGADEIMKRAIARRGETRDIPFSARIHTASSVDIDNSGSLLKVIPDGSTVGESDGMIFYDAERGARIRIDAVRRTAAASGPARSIIENFESLGNYFSIDDERIVLLNTAIPSPLAADAAERYIFELAGRAKHEGIATYEIGLHPATRLYPGFTGKLWIAEGSYDVVAMELTPSEETAIPFVRDLHLAIGFAPVEKGIYRPSSIEMTGRGDVRAVALGVVKPAVEFTIRTEFDQVRINVPMPDSIRNQSTPIVIAANAESAGDAYWAQRGSLSARAPMIRQSAGSAAATGIGVSISPYVDYNRAGAMSLGIASAKSFGPLAVGGMGGYSFGLERPIGEVTMSIGAGGGGELGGTIRGGVFSSILGTTLEDRSYPRIMNSLAVMALHQDYYNYFRSDGWSAGGEVRYGLYKVALTYEQSRQFSIGNNADWSVLTGKSKEFQVNPMVEDGNYGTTLLQVTSGRVAPFLKITPVQGPDFRWSFTGLMGRERIRDVNFKLGEVLASLSIPVAYTGYNPMTVTLLGAAGGGTSTLPPQYQFRLRTSAATFGKPGGFVSPPKGLYGGTEYIAFGGEFNLTDLPWRAIGLPTYNGRGIELIVGGASARYHQRHATGEIPPVYIGTGDLWYSEVGLALSRIPLFLTDIVSGRVDARWGLGPLGQFGANFTLVVPF